MLGAASGDDEALIEAFVEQTGVSFPVVYDEGYLISQVNFPSSLSPFPRQILIDADGRIAYVASEHSETDLRSAVEATGVTLSAGER